VKVISQFCDLSLRVISYKSLAPLHPFLTLDYITRLHFHYFFHLQPIHLSEPNNLFRQTEKKTLNQFLSQKATINMIFSRLLSLILRFAEFVSAIVVMGLIAHFIHIGGPPRGREIYTIILAVFSALAALIWMIPTFSHMLHIPADFILSLGWFAAFGVLVNWLGDINCGSAFSWGNIGFNRSPCSEWQAAEAFSFLAALFFLLSALLGLYVSRYGEPRRSHVGSRV